MAVMLHYQLTKLAIKESHIHIKQLVTFYLVLYGTEKSPHLCKAELGGVLSSDFPVLT